MSIDGKRTKTKAHFRRGSNDVRFDAALDAADIEAKPGEAAEARVRLRFDECHRTRSPAHRLMHRAVGWRIAARCMARAAAEAHQHRTDAAMREHRFAARRLGDDDRLEGC